MDERVKELLEIISHIENGVEPDYRRAKLVQAMDICIDLLYNPPESSKETLLAMKEVDQRIDKVISDIGNQENN